MYEYAARLDRVIDGDTIDLIVDLGFDLLGINCPEHGTIAGNDATAYTREWLTTHGPDLLLRTVLDRSEKFGRILGQVIADGHILNNDLVTVGHAVDYDGGPRARLTQGRGTLPAPRPYPDH